MLDLHIKKSDLIHFSDIHIEEIEEIKNVFPDLTDNTQCLYIKRHNYTSDLGAISYIVPVSDSELSVEDGKLIWHMPEITPHVCLSYNTITVKDSNNDIFNAYLKTIRLDSCYDAQLKYKGKTPSEIKQLVIDDMSGRAASDIAYIVYDPNACHIDADMNEKMILAVMHDKKVSPTSDVAIVIKADNPYDFVISESDISYTGDPDLKFGILALPVDDTKNAKRRRTLTNNLLYLDNDCDFKVYTATNYSDGMYVNGDANSTVYSFSELASYIADANFKRLYVGELNNGQYDDDYYRDLQIVWEADITDKRFSELRQKMNSYAIHHMSENVSIPKEFVKSQISYDDDYTFGKKCDVYMIPSNKGKYQTSISLESADNIWNGRVNAIKVLSDPSYTFAKADEIHFGKDRESFRFNTDHDFGNGVSMKTVIQGVKMFDSIGDVTRMNICKEMSSESCKSIMRPKIPQEDLDKADQRARDIESMLTYGSDKLKDMSL